jgi:hypothetical protein
MDTAKTSITSNMLSRGYSDWRNTFSVARWHANLLIYSEDIFYKVT